MTSTDKTNLLQLQTQLKEERKFTNFWRREAVRLKNNLKVASQDRAEFAKKVTVLEQRLEEKKPKGIINKLMYVIKN